MSDTPRTDAFGSQPTKWGPTQHDKLIPEWVSFARQLERELAAAQKDAKRYQWLRDEAPIGAGDMASVRGSHSAADIDAAIDEAAKANG